MKFLEINGVDIHITNNDGNDAYLLAAISGNLDIMIYLETKGFDIYIKNNIEQNAYTITYFNKIKEHLLTLRFKKSSR
jgi:ankyrin repeat protein